MANKILLLVEKPKPIKQKVNNHSILWYDPFYKKTLTFEGIGLNFIVKKVFRF